MRLATVRTDRGLRLHVRSTAGDGYVDVADATGEARYAELGAVLAEGEVALDAIRRVASREGTPYRDEDLGPAVPRPPRVLCLGVNYLEHALEGGRKAPSWPESFVRGADTVAAPYGPLVRPALSERFDYEGELGLVIGAGGRLIPSGKALEAIAGYVVLNDASAREWQRAASQWTPGKNFDGSMPIGPWVVTTDEVEVSDAQLTTTLNGQVVQSARTSQMIVGVPAIVEYLSSFTTLRPGDVIATGTPGGVGFARNPPVWLKAGDVVEVSIEGVGSIRNQVVDEAVDVSDWPWRPAAKTSSL
ncbi:MAG: fumarylacetoacetate hydrolase family protein [Acidimicrobiales bacterium]